MVAEEAATTAVHTSLASIMPLVVSSGLTLGLVVMRRFSRVSLGVSRVKTEELQGSIDELSKTLEKKSDEARAEWQKVWTELNKLTNKTNLHQYRLDEVQRIPHRNNNNNHAQGERKS